MEKDKREEEEKEGEREKGKEKAKREGRDTAMTESLAVLSGLV